MQPGLFSCSFFYSTNFFLSAFFTGNDSCKSLTSFSLSIVLISYVIWNLIILEKVSRTTTTITFKRSYYHKRVAGENRAQKFQIVFVKLFLFFLSQSLATRAISKDNHIIVSILYMHQH